MRVEEIALRQEIRQMLNEAGFNKNTLKDLVKAVIEEESKKIIKQSDVIGYTKMNIDSILNKTTEKVVREKITNTIVGNYFNQMTVDVKINPIMSSENKE